jgi:hypothetical protein
MIRQRHLHKPIRHSKVLPPLWEWRVCNLNQQPLQRIFHSPIQIKLHLVQPSEPFGIEHALVDEAPRKVTPLDELRDQMFAFPARDRAQFLEYDVSEEIEGLVDCIEWTFRGLGKFEGGFH